MGVPIILQQGMNQMTAAVQNGIRNAITKGRKGNTVRTTSSAGQVKTRKVTKRRSPALTYYKVKSKKLPTTYTKPKKKRDTLGFYKVKTKKVGQAAGPKFGSPAWRAKYGLDKPGANRKKKK